MTREDEKFFFQFHEQQKIELAMAAIDQRVLMGMIEDIMYVWCLQGHPLKQKTD
jgi:hypothetical protein